MANEKLSVILSSLSYEGGNLNCPAANCVNFSKECLIMLISGDIIESCWSLETPNSWSTQHTCS